ncbi:MAG: DUF1080 domain-containing protein [Acidobacteriota bacterium]
MVLGLLGGAIAAHPAEPRFKPLFNGRDLRGWVNVNCAPETFTVRDGMIHCDGIPTGALRTQRQYENFVLELEWRHLKPGGNAGVFVRLKVSSRNCIRNRSFNWKSLNIEKSSFAKPGPVTCVLCPPNGE